MLKIIPPGAYTCDQPLVSEIKISSRGLIGHDRRALEKRAGTNLLAKLASSNFLPGEVPVHVIALGAYEGTGSNRNGDGFYAQSCRDRHHTFVKNAFWFKNHQNKNKAVNRGHFKYSAFNEDMLRIELLGVLNGNQEAAARNGGIVAEEELQKLAASEDIPTSMGCLLNPDTPVLTTNGYARIADIKVGTMVYTHEGRWRRVYRLNRRPYTGTVIKVDVEGVPFPLELTADHPMYAKLLKHEPAYAKGRKSQRAIGRWIEDSKTTLQPFDWLHASHLGRNDRIAARPVTHFPGVPGISDRLLAELLGIYTAEGHISFSGDNPNTVGFSIHVDDWARRGVPEIIGTLSPDVKVTVEAHRQSKFGMRIVANSSTMAAWFLDLVGHLAKDKRIPAEIFNANEECKLAFLGRWLDGDGWIDGKGSHWSSTNFNLLLQGRDLLLSLGIPSSIYRIKHPPRNGKVICDETIEYTLNVSHIDTPKLRDFSAKVAASPYLREMTRRKPACMSAIGPNFFAYRIAKVSTYEVENAITYNFEVEDDESYSLLGLVSHNCSVSHDVCSGCGKKSRFTHEYCDEDICTKYGGLKHNIGRTFRDGHTLHAKNPDPTWFEMSTVGRNADRISFGMGVLDDYSNWVKTASAQRMGGGELAKYAGLVTPPWLYDTTDPWLLPLVREQIKIAGELIAAEDRMQQRPSTPAMGLAMHDSMRLGKLDAELNKQACISALHRRGCLLPVSQFLQLLSPDNLEKCAAIGPQVLSALPGAYNRLVASPNFEQIVRDNPYAVEAAENVKVAAWAAANQPAWSLAGEFIVERAQRAVLRHVQAKTAAVREYSPVAEKLADEYALYALAFVAAQPEGTDRAKLVDLVIQNNYWQQS